MKAALVIMAAGMGSRYGGSKQVDGIGPDGEILMEYSIYDAIRAGFTKVVFIIKPEMRELVETLCGRRVCRHDGGGRIAGRGLLCLSGLFQRAGILFHSDGAHQALRHGARRALCAELRRRAVYASSTPTITMVWTPTAPSMKSLGGCRG